MPLSLIQANSKEELISKIIEMEINSGKSKEQAAAIAYEEAKRRGFSSDQSINYPTSQYYEYSATIDSVQTLKGVVRVNVTMAAEMVQNYHISEIPWLKDKIGKNVEYIKVFKPYSELKNAISDLETRNIKQIPFVMPHSKGTFTEDQLPERLSKFKDQYKFDYVQDNQIVGWVKEFYFDDVTKKIKGWLYLPTTSKDEDYLEFIQDVINKKVFNVSIGFICDWNGAGEHNGEGYTLTQTNIQIGHLAGLINAQGKCPAGICGINQDSHVEHYDYNHLLTHNTINGQNYFISTGDVKKIEPIIIAECPCKNKNTSDQTTKNDSYSNGLISQNKINKDQEDFLMETEEEKKKRLEEEEKKKKEKEASMSKDAEFVKDLLSELHDTKLKLDVALQTISDQKKSLSEKEEKLKVYEENDRIKFTEILGGKDTVVLGKKVSEMCMHDLSFAAKFKQELADASLKNGETIKMPNQDEFLSKRNPAPKIEALESSGCAFNGGS